MSRDVVTQEELHSVVVALTRRIQTLEDQHKELHSQIKDMKDAIERIVGLVEKLASHMGLKPRTGTVQ